MIYLKSENVLFLKPRKVAGTSFEVALSRCARAGDIVTPITKEDEQTRASLGGKGPQNYLKGPFEYEPVDVYRLIRYRTPALKFFNHIAAEQTRGLLGERTFDNAIKVSIVRNPFDRLVSMYYWSTRNVPSDNRLSFRAWAIRNPQFFPQNIEHYTVNGDYILDHAIQYENLTDDCRNLESAVPSLNGIAAQMAKIRTKSTQRPKKKDLSSYFGGHEDLIQAVKFFNREIIERFGYEANFA